MDNTYGIIELPITCGAFIAGLAGKYDFDRPIMDSDNEIVTVQTKDKDNHDAFIQWLSEKAISFIEQVPNLRLRYGFHKANEEFDTDTVLYTELEIPYQDIKELQITYNPDEFFNIMKQHTERIDLFMTNFNSPFTQYQQDQAGTIAILALIDEGLE